MKKNYFAPKASIIETLSDEYCVESSLSSANVIVENGSTNNIFGEQVDETLGDEF